MLGSLPWLCRTRCGVSGPRNRSATSEKTPKAHFLFHADSSSILVHGAPLQKRQAQTSCKRLFEECFFSLPAYVVLPGVHCHSREGGNDSAHPEGLKALCKQPLKSAQFTPTLR
jgi:hypothetical protein